MAKLRKREQSTVADYMRLRQKMLEEQKKQQEGEELDKEEPRVSVEVNDYGVWI